VSLERGPLSLASTTEKLLERKSSGSGLENRDYGRMVSTALTTQHRSIRKTFAVTSPESGGRSVSVVRSWTQATEFNHGVITVCCAHRCTNPVTLDLAESVKQFGLSRKRHAVENKRITAA
jgi:hypothetical protein